MMQYGGELMRRIQQQNGRAQRRPPLPAELIKPPYRQQGA